MQLRTLGNVTGILFGVGSGAVTAWPPGQFLAPYLFFGSVGVWGTMLLWYVYANRQQVRAGSAKLGSFYFILPCFALAILGMAAGTYGLGIRAAVSPPTQPSNAPSLQPARLLPKDRERMNDALATIYGIIKTRMIGAIDQLHGSSGVQSFLWGNAGDRSATLLRMRARLVEIENCEGEIDAVFRDKNYSHLGDEIRKIVKPSGYSVAGTDDDLQRKIRDFLSTVQTMSERFPKPDPQLNRITENEAKRLDGPLFRYTDWANETLHDIEAAQAQLRQQQQ